MSVRARGEPGEEPICASHDHRAGRDRHRDARLRRRNTRRASAHIDDFTGTGGAGGRPVTRPSPCSTSFASRSEDLLGRSGRRRSLRLGEREGPRPRPRRKSFSPKMSWRSVNLIVTVGRVTRASWPPARRCPPRNEQGKDGVGVEIQQFHEEPGWHGGRVVAFIGYPKYDRRLRWRS